LVWKLPDSDNKHHWIARCLVIDYRHEFEFARCNFLGVAVFLEKRLFSTMYLY
jgi:hypothetical protein